MSAGFDHFYVNEVVGLSISEPRMSQDFLGTTLAATSGANSVRRVFFQQAAYEVGELVRMWDSDLVRKLSWILNDRYLQLALIFAIERHKTNKHLVHYDTNGPPVCRITIAILIVLLWSHVGWGPMLII